MLIDVLRDIATRHPRTILTPVGFFVARSGVLTLAYEGFCSAILNIKSELADAGYDLPPEYPGSMWPKTSLGALQQDVRLTMIEIEELHTLCLGWDTYVRQNAKPIQVTTLHVIDYLCRSLEKVETETVMPLSLERTSESKTLPAWHLKDVDDVLAQFNIDNLQTYSAEIQQSGHHERHYRTEQRGRTLVIRTPVDAISFVTPFKNDVDSLLPDHYAWFEDDSLHVTIRNLTT